MNRRNILGGVGVIGAMAGGVASAAPLAKSTLNAVWVHGTTVNVEDLSLVKSVDRYGWGANVSGQPGKSTWLHVAIPTPVIVDDVRVTLKQVFVLFKTNGATLLNVHVYDGVRKIAAFDNLIASGDHSARLDARNTFVLPSAPSVAFGIGVSFRVGFSQGFDSEVPTDFLLASVGADFIRTDRSLADAKVDPSQMARLPNIPGVTK